MQHRLPPLVVLLVAGCGSAAASSSGWDPPARPVDHPSQVADEPARVIRPGVRVPAFRVQTRRGRVVDSKDVVGKRGLVLVFFTTWCPVCERKMPMIRGVLAGLGGELTVLGVSLDEEETWGDVPGYVARHGLDFGIVRGARYPEFASAYDPMGGIPWVLVVDRSGHIVDAQMGIAPDHLDRLVLAIEIARGHR